jgi:deoxyribonucleoside regulator
MDQDTMSHRDLLIAIAKMYYIDGRSQDEIASVLHMSRSNVSRLTKKCVDEKIIEFRVNDTSSMGMELQKQIKELYNLKEVIVVSSDFNKETSKANVGKAAAKYLESVIFDGMLLGIAWGTTLYYLVQDFKPSRIVKADVIQIIGGTGAQNSDTDGQELAKNISKSLNGDCYILQAPLYVQSKVLKELLLEEENIKQHFGKFENIDIAIIGLGSNSPKLSASYRSGYITREDAEKWIEVGAVGDICGHKIDINGRECATNIDGLVIGIDLEQLKKIPSVIGVASGVEKTDAIIAGLRGKYMDVLVIDESAALSVLSREVGRKNLPE